ncbi:MAG: Stk1 family PASTA domain-containing Ser/Thr kinase [Microthrixaceae bacterium]|nr:Stk1 family PASTA domain-containing Ser/Thr kinase [Microthrixaceae bacterium]
MSDPDLRVLGDRYELHRRLARGGMAQVYLARDSSLDRPVAIKELVPEFATDPSFVERFRREAQAAANLAHPNIVGVYDWGTQDGTYYIVMEYIDGPSLSQVIRRDGPLHPRRAAELTSEVAGALGFAHSRGVVHRDVKPGNVLLTGSGQSKVTDFGIARALSSAEDDLTQAGSVMGTATYFSPEQAQGLPVDPRSDLYSLGVVLYEMLTGRAPFTGDTPLAIAYKHVQDQPAPPSSIITDLPAGIEAIVMKLLSKRPDDRYASAEELRVDLRRFLSGERTNAEAQLLGAAAAGAATAATAATMVQPSVAGEPELEPEEHRSRTGWFLAAMVVLLALLAGGLFWWANGLNAEVTVPDLVGETREEAEQQLADRGLVASVTEEPNAEVDAGRVSAQDPESGSKLSEGDTVELVVSTGAATKEVPDVVGRPENEARFILDAEDFEVRVENIEDPDAESGSVVSQDPAGGVEAPEGSTVTIQVSLGPGEEVVPDVSGQSLSSAQSELQARGFRIGGPEEEPSDSVPAGQVVRTEPAAGETAERNSTVTVYVSSGVERVQVPYVIGESQGDASARLRGAGFEVRVEERTVDPGDPTGVVVYQDPAGGERADKGSVVEITVGVAATTTSTSSSSTTTTSSP